MLWSTCRTPVPERVKLQEVEPSPEAVPAAVIWMLPSMTPLAVPVSLTPPVQVASKTPSMAVALWEVMFQARSLQACDEAGNPVLAERHSPSHDWTEGLVLTASSYPTSKQPWLRSTVPASRSALSQRVIQTPVPPGYRSNIADREMQVACHRGRRRRRRNGGGSGLLDRVRAIGGATGPSGR